MKEILSFRRTQYLERELAHLCEQGTQDKERDHQIDVRSRLFWIEQNHRILGTVRTTPYPFELQGVRASFFRLGNQYRTHVEFSRLLVASSARDTALTRILLAAAFLHVVRDGHTGVVAIARAPQKRLFRKFGLTAVTKAVRVPERQGAAYWMLEGSCKTISQAVLLHSEIENPTIFRQSHGER